MALIKCKDCGSKISTDASACPHCGAKVVAPSPIAKKPRKWLPIVVLMMIAWPLVMLSTYPPDSTTPPASSPAKTPASAIAVPPPKKIDPADRVKIINYSARKGGFNNVMLGTFKLKNNNPFPVKDFKIVCAQFGQSGTELPAAVTTLYERLEPGQTKTFKKVNLGLVHSQSVSFNCSIAVVTETTSH